MLSILRSFTFIANIQAIYKKKYFKFLYQRVFENLKIFISYNLSKNLTFHIFVGMFSITVSVYINNDNQPATITKSRFVTKYKILLAIDLKVEFFNSKKI